MATTHLTFRRGVNIRKALLLDDTLITATAAEINLLDTAVAGTVVASKAVIAGAAGEVDALTITALNAGLTLLATDSKLEFRDTGLFIYSNANGKLTISADGVSTDDVTISGTVTLDDDLITPTTKKIQFRDAGLYIQSSADGKLLISSDGAGVDDITLSGTVTLDDDLITPTTKKLQLRDSGLFIQSSADGKLLISSDGVSTDDITLSGTVTLDDDLITATTKKIQFRDAGLYINSGADGKLSIVSDGVSTDDITLSGTVTHDDDVLIATTKELNLGDAGTYIEQSADGKLLISSDGVGADDITLDGTVTVNDTLTLVADKSINLQGTGKLSLAGTPVTASGAELNALDITAAGTLEASKAIVVDAALHLNELRLTASGLKIGASGAEAAMIATAAELNLLNTATAGTAVASKAAVLGANKNLDTLVIADGGLCLGAVGGTAITSTAAELNLLDTSSVGVAVASKALALGTNKNIDMLVVADGGLALGSGAGVAIVATAAELNQLSDSILTVVGNLTTKRFVGSDLSIADVDDLAVVGVSPSAITAGQPGVVQVMGIAAVTADAPLTLGLGVKVGVAGRATKYTSAQTVIQTAIAGEATAFTQPGGATTLEILQAADVEADRGRGITIVGSNAGGVAITETIVLDISNTTTVVVGAISFTKVSGVYTANGAVLGAQSVTIRASGAGATVCTLANATSELGADVPAQTIQAYCNGVTVTGPNADATYVTIVGIGSTDAALLERGTLDGASPSKFTTTGVFRQVDRICLGEFTNAGAGAVKTDSTTDTAGMKVGVVLKAAAARADDALILLKPNA